MTYFYNSDSIFHSISSPLMLLIINCSFKKKSLWLHMFSKDAICFRWLKSILMFRLLSPSVPHLPFSICAITSRFYKLRHLCPFLWPVHSRPFQRMAAQSRSWCFMERTEVGSSRALSSCACGHETGEQGARQRGKSWLGRSGKGKPAVVGTKEGTFCFQLGIKMDFWVQCAPG